MDQKLEKKRLCVYLFLTFAFAWIIFGVYALTGHKWDGENTYLEGLVGLGMLAPVLAHVITRLLTKEGFAVVGKDSMMLGISFKEQKWGYYLFAILAPWLYFELGHALIILMFPSAFSFENYKQLEVSLSVVLMYPLICIVGGLVSSFAAFGEEGGWRGYMMPKLIKLFGIKKAVIIGGILWGLWHAPLTCIGHNFGTDYPGFPYVGIIVMCLDCTFMGMLLTFVTIRTNSIWPAAFMHAVNNQNPGILKCFIDVEVVEKMRPFPMFEYIGLLLPNILIGSVCLVLMLRSDK